MKNSKVEIWKDVLGYEGLYKISNLGNVLSCRKKHGNYFWKEFKMATHFDGSGYRFVVLQKEKEKKQPKLHRLIAEHFIPNSNNYPIVNHINGIKSDNSIENLEWCTQSQNILHSFKNGMSSQLGSKNAYSKLKEIDVLEIRKLVKNNFSRKSIAFKFNISLPTICDIIKLKTWKHV